MTHKLRDMDLSQGRQYAYYVLPKVLISGKQFGELEIGAKVLYSLMLNRYALSSQHSDDYTDETGRTYIVYPMESISADLHVSKPTATRLVNQLEQFGLIERKKRGQGLAALIYIKDFTQLLANDPQQTLPTDELSEEPEEKKFYPKKSKSFTSRSKDSLPLEVKNLYPIKNDSMEPDSSNLSFLQVSEDGRKDEITEEVKESIEYDILTERWGGDMANMVLSLIVSVLMRKGPVTMGRYQYPEQIVKERYRNLSYEDVDWALNKLLSNPDVRNQRAYLTTLLYNSAGAAELQAKSEFEAQNQKTGTSSGF